MNSSPIRVFVGVAANHEDAESQAVLEYTLRKYASQPVEITWMMQSRDPASRFYCGPGGWDTSRWTTPFSGFRWAIPALCDYKGRAIYMDSDVLVRADIAELWNMPFLPNKSVIAKGGQSAWRFCVSLWDCEKVAPHVIPPLEDLHKPGTHREMTVIFRDAPWVQPFPRSENWNCLDLEQCTIDDPSVKAIHYTSMSTQPQLRWAIPRLERKGIKHWYEGQVKEHHRRELITLFDTTLIEATRSGFPIDRYTQHVPFGPYDKASTKNYTRTSESTARGLT